MTEYSLDDFLADPITRQLMARDRVQEHEIRTLADRMRRHSAHKAQRPTEPRSFKA